MARLKDFEGWPLPPDNSGDEVWDLRMVGGLGGGNPYVSLNIPMFFEVVDDDGEAHEYNSFGVIGVDLRDVLDDYLQTIDSGMDDDQLSAGAAISAMLREYADKIDSAITPLNPIRDAHTPLTAA